ncbi:putative virion structural protein [Erwinia phage vB_EamM_Stratton]|uniref:Putative virion structural protein n=1 Tax=Erwinia phage vB_EamM_Stratton TaxID=1883378 RepID=A0A1B2IH46_9CAUD|nr:putative virion structural protein [Erwinia phage vB_EamM_Stratton]
MGLNYSKPSDLLVFDLLNRDNPGLPIPVDANNVIIEKITQVTPGPANNNRNTQARLRGVQGMGFRDSLTLYYDRISLARLIPWWSYGTATRTACGITNFTAANLHELLPSILDTYGINLQPKDVTNQNFGGVGQPNYNFTYSCNALATSPAYFNGFTGYLMRGLPVLDTSITIDTLNVMKHPIGIDTNQMCVDLMTWGIDFTAYKNLLTVTSGGLPNWAGLRNLLDSLGVPNYAAPMSSNTVQDVATTGNQWANKDYDRVVIQTGIDETGAKGVAYYHYNN